MDWASKLPIQLPYVDFCGKITESAELEGTHNDHQSPTPSPAQEPPQESHHMPESIIQMLLGLWQAWCCDHFSGEFVPELNHLLGEEPLSNIKPKPLLTQLQAIPWGSVTGHHRGEISTCPSSCPYRELVTAQSYRLSLCPVLQCVP
ncbi:hypothetical protein BTVI_22170 [Pitangus sulphuratus]|nr:hypothetical protein BTVI_22170 [Pitangus sulphuratus]